MRDRLALGAYLAAVVLATTVHRFDALGLLLLAALLLAGRDAPHLARRALLAVLVFTGVVSLSWLAASLWHLLPSKLNSSLKCPLKCHNRTSMK